jgi:hypothetical protein
MSNILTTFPKKRKRRVVAGFMGTYIPKSQADYVTLFCNALEVPKISIMKTLLTEWMNGQIKVYTNEVLEKRIAENAHKAWTKTEGKSFESFMKELQFELRRKKLEPDVTGRILTLVTDEKNKNS